MKSKFLILIVLLACSLTGCFKDESNTSVEMINPIVIDMGGASTSVSTYLLDTLEIKPVVYKIGTDDARLKYKWEISGNDLYPTVIDTKMSLKALVTVPPSANPYTVTLTVTDEDTGLQSFQLYSVSVLSNMGMGLLVADSRDGANTDLNLVMAKEFSQSYITFDEKDTKVLYQIYSQVNGAPMEGLVTHMVSTGHYTTPTRTFTAVTPNHAYRMDPYDYELVLKDNGLFFVSVPEFNPSYVGYDDSAAYDIMVIGGKIYPRWGRWGNVMYKPDLELTDRSHYNVRIGTSSIAGYTYTALTFYDEDNNRFIRCDGAYTELQLMDQPIEPGPFDFTNVGDLTAVYMGMGNMVFMSEVDSPADFNTTYAVMKSRTGSDHWLLTYLTGDSYDNVPRYRATGKYKLSDFPGFPKVVSYECSPIENVLFYATEDKIYSLLLSGNNPQSMERYTVEPGEKITSIMLWRMTGQGAIRFKDSTTEEGYYEGRSGNRMMIVATYNEATGEGKITAIPLINVGSGTLETDKAFHKVYDGFGRIVCMTPQSL